jgi:hypothetical protein
MGSEYTIINTVSMSVLAGVRPVFSAVNEVDTAKSYNLKLELLLTYPML